MTVKTVLGLDPSSLKLAAVVTSAPKRDKPTLHVTHFEFEEYERKCEEAFDWTFDLLMEIRERDDQPPAVYLEAPVMGVGGPGATIPQAYVSGAVMTACAQAGARVKLVNNQTWKKRAMGAGNLNKVQVRERMYEVWPELVALIPIMEKGEFKGFPDQDLIDAGGLNLFGWWNAQLVERLRKRRDS